MTSIQHNVRQARFRLGLNAWLIHMGWCLVFAAGVWVALVLAVRLWDFPWPLHYLSLALVAGCVLVSTIWAFVGRADDMAAATALDDAAGLKERTSTGLHCLSIDDPFAQATVADAEQINSRISVRSFMRYCWPSSLSYATAALLIALMMTLLPIQPLEADDALARDRQADVDFTRSQVKKVNRRLTQLRDQVQKNPALEDLKTPLKTLDDLPLDEMQSAESVRREAIKKIDRLADSLREEKKGPRFDQLKQMKRMFRGLKANKQPQTPTEKLSQALAKGDFRSAQKAVKELKEQLALLPENKDPKKSAEIKKQLDQLAKKLNQAAKQQQMKEQMQKQMQNAGMDKKTAEKMLENLSKEDMNKAAEQMKKQGMTDQQAKEMSKKMQAMQQAGQKCSNMSQSLQKTAQAMKNSSMADASAQLDEVADQLNSMESLEQQMGEMDSTLADLQDMKNDLASGPKPNDQPGECSSCNGKGCGQCGRQGSGSGQQLARGRGGRADEEVTPVRYVKQRTKVFTTKGSLISKMFVDGEQVKGDISSEAVELISAAQRDATDAVSNNKVPNQYRESVKQYFSDIAAEFEVSDESPGGASAEEPANTSEDGS